jgi:tetratricopeptide (TPR) repeat protein
MQRRNDNTHAHKAVRFLGTAIFAVVCFGITYGVLEASPDHVTNSYRSYNNEGYALAQKGDPAAAIPFLKQAVELNPAHPIARNNLANAYRSEKNYDEARRQWDNLLSLDPDSLIAFVGLGNVASDEQHYDEAVAYYESALRVDDAQPVTLFNLGNAYYNKNDARAAIAAYEKSLDAAPNFAQAHYNLSQAYAHDEDYPNALRHLELAVKLDPGVTTKKNVLRKLLENE